MAYTEEEKEDFLERIKELGDDMEAIKEFVYYLDDKDREIMRDVFPWHKGD